MIFKNMNLRHQKIILTLFIVISIIMIFMAAYLIFQKRSKLDQLATASMDNMQWNLSQIEVEYLVLLNEINANDQSDQSDIVKLRRRFDVFYSRVNSLQDSTLYKNFRIKPEAVKTLKIIDNYRKSMVLFFDQGDVVLRKNLPIIKRQTAAIKKDVRMLALQGVTHFAAEGEQFRNRIYKALFDLTISTIVLLAFLLLFIFFILKMVRNSLSTLDQNELISTRMSAIVTTSLDAIIAMNDKGIIVEYNGAAEEIFGYSKEEAIGEKMAELIIPDHLKSAHYEGMKNHSKNGENKLLGHGRVRVEGKRKCGAIFPLELSLNKTKSSKESVYISYLRDISEEVKREEELRQARDVAIEDRQVKTRFLAVMSHEMRTPLNGLLGTMDLLSTTPLDKQQKHYLHIMEKSSNLLLAHVNDVLDISRLEAGKMSMRKELFDLNQILEELIAGQETLAIDKGSTIKFTALDEERLMLNGDPLRLRQALLNILGNAIKFTHNGAIHIECEQLNNDFIEIRIADTGIGIAEADQERIFEDFNTLDTSYKRQYEGTGLGLGIARRFIESMGGEIGVESELGEGSLFWVRIPNSGAKTNAKLISDDQDQNFNQEDEFEMSELNILLVEDNEINRMVAREFLEGDGHKVSEAHNGAEGIASAERYYYDLILMDISMPIVDGVSATTTIRNGKGQSKDSPIFALTAHALEEDVERFTKAGINSVIYKPITRKSLRTAIKTLRDKKLPDIERHHMNYDGVLNIAAFGDFRKDIGEEHFSTLYKKFVIEMDQTLAKLSAPIIDENQERIEIAALAHRLAGSAAMFGANHLWKELLELEILAKKDNQKHHRDEILNVLKIWVETRKLLSELV